MSEDRPLLICNSAHECRFEPCFHKKPHMPQFRDMWNCGPSMECSGAKILSGCVSVRDGKYMVPKRVDCPHCGGRGYHTRKVYVDAETLNVVEEVER